MKITQTSKLITAALAAAFTITSGHAQTRTPDSVKTRVGDLKFEQGYPTEETRKVFDEIDRDSQASHLVA